MKTDNHAYFLKFIIGLLLFSSNIILSQTTTPFAVRYETAGINGDLTIIGNSILGHPTIAPYNDATQNNFIDMVFVDIDSDATTFNSSSANFTTNTCNRVVYAGLYWGAVAAPTSLEPDKIKFKIPGGLYQDLTADADMDLIYYKDVTTIVAANTNVSGDYFVANISTSEGRNSAAGWSMVIVYEDPTESRKYISTFDGFSAVRNNPNNIVDFTYSGFVTPPSGPVEGRVGVAALEGDLSWSGDQMLFRADANIDISDPNANFTALYDDLNDADNFFNSRITKDGTYMTNRNLSSENTLGWDQKLINFTTINSGNNLIGNGETGATVRVTNTAGGDHIYTFLNTFSINIIEPDLQVLTSVEDTSGNQITHASPVQLGATVWYNINFQNIGTDNAENTYILNTLPFNVTLDESSIVLPTGVTYTFNSTLRELRFNIDNSLVVRESDPNNAAYDIRYQVTASSNCFDYTDACTNLLENSISSYYDGETSGQNISNQPGLNGINGCGLGNIGSMDLFVNTSSCNFDSTETFCNNNLTISGHDGYNTYEWVDQNGNPVGNTQVITVSGPGEYTVTQTRVGCSITTRVVTVLGIAFALTPTDALCKDQADGKIKVDITDTGTSFIYELSQGGTVIETTSSLASKTHEFTGLDIGTYSVKVTNDSGCFNSNTVVIEEPTLLQASSVKLFNITTCNGSILNGSLQATGSGGTPPYEYSIDGGNTYQTEDTFSVSTENTYQITVRDANGCAITTDVAVGFDQEIIYEVTKEDIICVGDSDGKINVSMTNNQGYTVTYSLDGTTYQASPNFTGLSKGTYELWVKKDNGFNVCETQITMEIEQLIYLQLEATTDFSCEGSSSTIIAQVDPIYQNDVTYTLNGSTSNTSGIFENISTGNHTVTVKHNEFGCSDEPITVFVDEYTPIDFQVVETGINEYTVVATGGEPSYEYSFDSPNDYSENNVLDLRSTRESRDYVFYVRDQRGCVLEKTIYLEFLDIEIPDFFTPNGDGYNDEWYPINIEIYPNISVQIFDRYQRMIATYKGNLHSWDGNYKGKPLPSGDYWYIVKLNDTADDRVFKGNFSLVR